MNQNWVSHKLQRHSGGTEGIVKRAVLCNQTDLDYPVSDNIHPFPQILLITFIHSFIALSQSVTLPLS
jgi:hypothetical protein